MDYKHETSCEPMEIDLSGTSAMSLDISYHNDPISIIKHEKDDEFEVRKQEKTFETVCSASPIDKYIRCRKSCNYDTSITKNYHNEDEIKTSIPIRSTPIRTTPIRTTPIPSTPIRSTPIWSTSIQSTTPNSNCNIENNLTKFESDIIKIKGEPNNILKRIRNIPILFGSIVIVIAIFTYNIINIKCADPMNSTKVRHVLEDNLIGQSKAIEKIVTSLSLDVKEKIIFFYGGTGVGKSFATSLLIEDVRNNSNIYHFTMPSFKQKISVELSLGMTVCKSSLFVIDDLKINDEIQTFIRELIERSKNAGNNITIILIYNCGSIDKNFNANCDVTFEKKLRDTFSEINTEKRFIKFESLSEEHLIKCIEKEISDENMDRDIIYGMLSYFDVARDGCKGVHSKMKFLNLVL